MSDVVGGPPLGPPGPPLGKPGPLGPPPTVAGPPVAPDPAWGPGVAESPPVPAGWVPGPPGGPPPPAAMVEAAHVSKWFKDLVALTDVSFGVGPGITALLGPNGAGKSTLLRVLCGLTRPSQGAVRILGRTPPRDLDVYRWIGLVPQQESVPETLTGLEFVTLCGELAGVRGAEGPARRAIGTVELDPDDPRPVATYSKGMRQRVKVAAAIVHDPPIVFLDEPLNGLDPTQRVRMIELFRRLGAEGRCVLVSSHVLEEVERFGSRILVVVAGRLAAEGDFHAIRDLMDDRPHRLQVRTNRPRELAAALLGEGVASGVSVSMDGTAPAGAPGAHWGDAPPGGLVWADTTEVHGLRRRIAVLARELDARLYEVEPLDDDLDSVFRYLVAGPARGRGAT
jgi:ABC-2 type transport system ATP-binding protein